MLFADVIGQKEPQARLLQMAREDRIPHALLLCGPPGSGKMAIALAFASYLLCQDKDKQARGTACGHCPQCVMLRKWHHPDLHFSYPTIKRANMSADRKPVSADFAEEWTSMLLREGPYFTIDQWMAEIGAENQQAIITAGESDSLNRKLSMKASQDGYKVSVIWLPERMNSECANKLLKLIEEPPLNTVFLLVSEEPGLLIDTIRSRTQRIDIKKIDDESVAQALVERRALTPDAAWRIARIANGNWTAAIREITAGGERGEFLEEFKSLTRAAYKRDVRALKKWSERIQAFGREKQKRFIDYFLRMVRESFVYNFQQPELNYMTADEQQFVDNFHPFVNEANILPINSLANRAARDIRQNANAKIVFFDMALQIAALIRKKI